MDNIDDHRFFLIIKKEKISFKNFDPINVSTLTKEIFLKNDSLDNIFLTLEKFLEKNMFEIEKRLKIFIKKIYIIFESDSVFEVGSSFRQNFTGVDFNYSQFNDSLIDIKNQLEKHSKKYEIIHMLIDKYIINGVVYNSLPDNEKIDELVVQVNFICLENIIVEKFKEIFLKYQISLSKILYFNYLQKQNNFSSENIIQIANENIDGNNSNEVFIIKKKPKKQGFFEKFFNFFN
jgi:hypothetical protein